MPNHGIILRVTHTGAVSTSLLVTDVHDGVDTNGRVANAKPGPLYIPVNSSVDLIYTSQVAHSFEVGAIRTWVDMGYLTAEFVFGTEFAAEAAIEVQEEGVTVEASTHTVNFKGAIITATNPSDGVVDVTVTGTGGAVVTEQDDVLVQATTTVLNFIGPGLLASDAGGGQVDVVATGTIGTLTFDLGAIQDIDAATDQFLPTTTVHRFTVTGGNYTLTSTPTINWPGAVAGQMLVLMNVNPAGSNHVILNRGVGEALSLSNANKKLDPGGSMTLMYNGSVWVELTHTESTTT